MITDRWFIVWPVGSSRARIFKYVNSKQDAVEAWLQKHQLEDKQKLQVAELSPEQISVISSCTKDQAK